MFKIYILPWFLNLYRDINIGKHIRCVSLYNKNGIILCILSLLCEFIPCHLKSSAYDPLHKFLPIVLMSSTLENNLLDPWTVVP